MRYLLTATALSLLALLAAVCGNLRCQRDLRQPPLPGGEAPTTSRTIVEPRHRQIMGEDHPNMAIIYNNLAINLNAQGKYKEAEEVFRKALAIRRKVLGEEHLATAQSFNNLAANLYAQGKYAEAEEASRKGLAIHRKVLGEEHPDTAHS